jgi:IclR family mhp operon transcriptional activator
MEADMRGVLRALAVLRALNVDNGASILKLHQTTGISRAALYRIVGTLHKAGYLALDHQTQSYLLTPLVKLLSEGYDEDAWITEFAGPLLDDLQQEVIWPTDLFTFFDDTMIMRRTTRRISPWTFDRAYVGLRIPLLVTACGRAYLANVPTRIADEVMERVIDSQDPGPDAEGSRDAMRQLLAKVRHDGYALREDSFMKETGSIAVPVLVDGVARCSIAITYIPSAISSADAVRKFAPKLKACAAELASRIAREVPALPSDF